MHEYTIVASLIDLCEKEATKHRAKAIKAVDIDVGRLSGVEVHFLEQSFDVFKEGTICENATLNIHLCEVTLFCEACGQTSTVEMNHFICPNCQSTDVQMKSGQELQVKSIEIIEDDHEML